MVAGSLRRAASDLQRGTEITVRMLTLHPHKGDAGIQETKVLCRETLPAGCPP